jgi:hypothetical protein
LKISCRAAVLAVVDLGYALFTGVAGKAPKVAGPSHSLTSPDVSAAGGGSDGANAIDNACDECCCSCGGSASCALNNLV